MESIFPESHYWTHFFCFSYLYRFIFRWENKKIHNWGTEMSPQYLNRHLFSYHYLFPVRINLHFFFSSLLPAFETLLASLLFTSISTNCKFWSQTLICYLYIPIMLFSPFISNIVGQSTMQLTCCGNTRNFRKIRLQSSLLNCDYTLQVLQHVSTRCNQRLHCNDVCVCFDYSNNTQVQTATFQTNGLRSVRLYVHNT